jgi:hypothetical protein
MFTNRCGLTAVWASVAPLQNQNASCATSIGHLVLLVTATILTGDPSPSFS